MRLKLKVKSMRILGGLSDDLKLPFAELYSPMNRFVRYRTVIAEKEPNYWMSVIKFYPPQEHLNNSQPQILFPHTSPHRVNLFKRSAKKSISARLV